MIGIKIVLRELLGAKRKPRNYCYLSFRTKRSEERNLHILMRFSPAVKMTQSLKVLTSFV